MLIGSGNAWDDQAAPQIWIVCGTNLMMGAQIHMWRHLCENLHWKLFHYPITPTPLTASAVANQIWSRSFHITHKELKHGTEATQVQEGD